MKAIDFFCFTIQFSDAGRSCTAWVQQEVPTVYRAFNFTGGRWENTFEVYITPVIAQDNLTWVELPHNNASWLAEKIGAAIESVLM
jgi:hypothetical protein